MGNDNFIKILVGLASAVTTLVLWYFNKDDLNRLIKNYYHPWKGINTKGIIELEKSRLIIENKEFLNDVNISKKFKYVFWPVVPTDSPNLIHLLSVFYLTKLSDNGLRIIVFIFDSYYEMIQAKSKEIAKQKVDKFEKDLYEMGFKKCWFKVERESNYINKNNGVDSDFAKRFYTYMGSLKYSEIIRLQKPYFENDTPSIRFFKPILNMLYLNLVPFNIGFTFSGFDEKQLWDTFSTNAVDGHNQRLTNIYLPILPNLSGGVTNVLDKLNNITHDDSIVNIHDKLKASEQYLVNGSLIHIIFDIVIKANKMLKVNVNDIDCRTYSSFDKIEDDIKNEILKEKILMSISNEIYELFHQQ